MKTLKLLGVAAFLAVSVQGINLGKCMGCHGKTFEKHAMGKSKIVKDMNSTAIVESIQGYQNNEGGPLKMIMKGQVKTLTEEEVKEVANLIKNI